MRKKVFKLRMYVHMSLRYTFRSEKKRHIYLFGKRSTTVRELKEYIRNNHRGVQNIFILKINSEKELDDSILLSRGSNVMVKRTISDFELEKNKKTISNPRSEIVLARQVDLEARKKRKHVQNEQSLPTLKKNRGIPKRFLVNYSAEISKDAEHLKEHCPNVKLTVRGDAQLKIS